MLMILFYLQKANQKNCKTIKFVLDEFAAILGLKPNLMKSQIYFSKNIKVQVIDSLSLLLGISHMQSSRKYLRVDIKGNYTS